MAPSGLPWPLGFWLPWPETEGKVTQWVVGVVNNRSSSYTGDSSTMHRRIIWAASPAKERDLSTKNFN